jgi:hypothetical protein
MPLITAIGALTALVSTVVMLKRVCERLTREDTSSMSLARVANRTPRLGRRQTMLEYDEQW